ncbi:MAG: phosphate ABC transporter substrate-binding protein [Bradyrhizobiaceae bacterium]|nr:MAG: phosphate ABC transporter substrate-binding protein [Bradyrhizobiaceae bacterium]
MAYPATGPVRLEVNLADYPVTRALKAGAVRSDLVDLAFTGPKTANEGFKPMLREGRFDAGELAIGTYLQARIYDKPLVLLPAVVMGRHQHQTILARADRGVAQPKDLEGRRVGIRTYSQTTGIWVRGILQHRFGVDLSRITWVCPDESHLAEYRDPPNVERASGRKVDQMLRDGDVDAAIGAAVSDPRVRPLIEDPQAAAEAWCRENQAVPINHLFVVRSELSATRPDAVREIHRMLAESKAAAGPAGAIDFHPFGLDANRRALELMIRYSVEQQIIPRPLAVDELFDATTHAL